MSKPKPTATTTPREALHALLQELNFKGMARVLDSELDRAERNGVSCAELVQRLLGEQASFQRERSLANRVAQAHLPWQWTIETFPFERQSGVSKAQILGLADLEFVRRADNLVLIGGPGTSVTAMLWPCALSVVSRRASIMVLRSPPMTGTVSCLKSSVGHLSLTFLR